MRDQHCTRDVRHPPSQDRRPEYVRVSDEREIRRREGVRDSARCYEPTEPGREELTLEEWVSRYNQPTQADFDDARIATTEQPLQATSARRANPGMRPRLVLFLHGQPRPPRKQVRGGRIPRRSELRPNKRRDDDLSRMFRKVLQRQRRREEVAAAMSDMSDGDDNDGEDDFDEEDVGDEHRRENADRDGSGGSGGDGGGAGTGNAIAV